MSFEKELQVAVAAVSEAAILCREVQSGITPETLEKKDRSPVTVADYGSQALVCSQIRDAFPDDIIIAEEDASALREADNTTLRDKVLEHVAKLRPDASNDDVCSWIDHGFHRDQCDRFWTLDPIDGTKGFLRRDQYAVSLALIIDGELKVAAMACPNLSVAADQPDNRGVVYTAIAGEGTFAQPLDSDDAPVKVQVSDNRKTADCRFCESVESGHSSHGDAAAIASQLNITQEPARLDSQAKYGVVARGEADIYLRLPTRADYQEKIWDHGGGALIIEEAGGKVTDIHGQALDFTNGHLLSKNKGVIATNGHVHEQVLAAVTEVLNLQRSSEA